MHHTHSWSLDGEHHVFTTHVKLKNIESLTELLAVKKAFKKILQSYNFEHPAIEVELDQETCSMEKDVSQSTI